MGKEEGKTGGHSTEAEGVAQARQPSVRGQQRIGERTDGRGARHEEPQGEWKRGGRPGRSAP